MRGAVAAEAEVARGRDESLTEHPLPEPVHDDAAGEGIVRMGDPVGEGGAARAFGGGKVAERGGGSGEEGHGAGRERFTGGDSGSPRRRMRTSGTVFSETTA